MQFAGVNARGLFGRRSTHHSRWRFIVPTTIGITHSGACGHQGECEQQQGETPHLALVGVCTCSVVRQVRVVAFLHIVFLPAVACLHLIIYAVLTPNYIACTLL